MKFCFKGILALLLSVFFISCNSPTEQKPDSEATEKNFVRSEQKPTFFESHEPKKKTAPFSDIVKVGETYYLAGQIGMDHKTRKLVDATIEGQTKKTLENIKEVLSEHKLHMTDVVKVTVILDHIEDFQAFNKVYEQYFPQKPARSTFAAEALAAGALIEIEVIAVRQ